MALTQTQAKALEQLEAHGPLDYQAGLYGFARPGAPRAERIQMATAKALVSRGLAVATRTKPSKRGELIDQLALKKSE